MKSFLLIVFLLAGVVANCQDLKRINKVYLSYGEIFTVLKDNKEIRQGQYLKYHKSVDLHNGIDLSAKTIESYGKYESGKKSGAWIFCNVDHPLNPLISIGEYENDMKSGQWVYFYSPALRDSGYITNLIRNQKYTRVIIPSNRNEEIQVMLDTTGVRVASSGSYLKGKKTGVWDYYSRIGQLVCKYDFSKNTVIYSTGPIVSGQLGGVGRLAELLFQAAREQNSDPFFFRDSKVSYEVTTFHDSINVFRLTSSGSEPFAKYIEKIFKSLSLDWIDYDPTLEENRIRVFVNYVVDNRTGTATIDSIIPMIKELKVNKQ
jgi:hypothetical protein